MIAGRRIGEAFIRVRPDVAGFSQAAQPGVVKAGKLGGRVFGGAFLGSLSGMLGAAGIQSAFRAISGFARDAFGEAREAAKIGRLTEAVIKSTGRAAKISVPQVAALADRISELAGVDDDVVQAGTNMLLTFCLEESAQALTKDRGWVSHGELRAGDEILAYDPDDDGVHWEPVDSVHRFQVAGDLVRWRSRQMDVLSTPTHRWWTVGQNDKASYTAQFQTTEEISGKQIRVKIGGGIPECFLPEPVWTDEIVEMAGWLITEGWVDWVRPSTPDRNRASFSQSETANPDKVKRIRDLVDRLRRQGHRIDERSDIARYNGSTMITWSFARDLGERMRALLPAKKLTVDLLTSLTREQGQLLLDTLIDGDGHIDSHGHRQYIQKDRSQLDVLAMLCSMLGIRTTDVSSRANDAGGSLYLNATNHAYGHALNPTREHYEGIVWCPHLRTGVWLARVRGRTFWTGNTNVRNELGKGNDIFNQAAAATLDMNAALTNGNVTAESYRGAMLQVGKALNDPVKGMNALRRAGVTFSDQQKKQIKAFVDQGKTAEAQKIILGELRKEFGGAAAASTDAAQKANVAWANFKERIGTLVLPIVGKLATVFTTKVLPVIEQRVIPALVSFGRWIRDTLIPAVKDFVAVAQEKLAAVMEAVRDAFERFRPVAELVKKAIGPAFKIIVDNLKKAWEDFRPVLTKLTPILKAIGIVIGVVIVANVLALIGILTGLSAVIRYVIIPVLKFLITVAEFVAKKFLRAFELTVSWFRNTFWPGVVNVFRSVGEFISRKINEIIAVARRIIQIWTSFRDAFARAKAAVVDKVGEILAFVRGIPDRIRNGVGSLASVLYNAGWDIIRGLVRGIRNAADSILRDVLNFVADKIPDWKGPLPKDRKLLFGAGRGIIEGLGMGMKSRVPSIKDMLGDLTTRIGTTGPIIANGGLAGGGVHLHLYNHGVIGSQRELDNWLTKSLDRLRRERRF